MLKFCISVEITNFSNISVFLSEMVQDAEIMQNSILILYIFQNFSNLHKNKHNF